MGVVARWLNVQIVKLLLDILPNLTILQEGIKLNDFHNLLLTGIKLVQIETNAVESAENGRSEIIILDDLVKDVADVGFVVLILTLAHVAGSFKRHAKDTRGLRAA